MTDRYHPFVHHIAQFPHLPRRHAQNRWRYARLDPSSLLMVVMRDHEGSMLQTLQAQTNMNKCRNLLLILVAHIKTNPSVLGPHALGLQRRGHKADLWLAGSNSRTAVRGEHGHWLWHAGTISRVSHEQHNSRISHGDVLTRLKREKYAILSPTSSLIAIMKDRI
ncbi:hypothetical protein DAEQUDRAFT_123712 [Daedalea quercina L-15889]|uniref:Uncharacterized protein n=1 Tax=Daedalea quercina L-15889 TaxID=1314783 RepID=A0A165RXX3_9APHY|nr:hypothetical protein DAEQUDRAFT_123712 [Daedalea quercina L-15889]